MLLCIFSFFLLFVNFPIDYRRRLIIKRQIANLARRQLFRSDIAFYNEMDAYAYVVPSLRHFIGPDGHLPLPLCLFAGRDPHGDIIALEDLVPSSHRMADRLKGLDYSHCKLVMQVIYRHTVQIIAYNGLFSDHLQELGVLHGTVRAMKQMAGKQFTTAREHLNEVVYTMVAADFYSHSLDSSLKEALHSLRQSNADGDLNVAIQKIDRLSGKMMFQIMYDCVVDVEEPWTVLCHGDLWINNLMFKYDATDRCVGVRLVDLQTMRYSSPVIDILHFLYTSVEFDVRDRHMEQLLRDYMASMCATVTQLADRQGDDDVVQPLQPMDFDRELFALRGQMRKKALYGLGICMWLMPAVTFHPDKIIDLDTVSLDDFTNSNQEKTMTQMQTPEYHKRMKETVVEFLAKGYLDDIE